MARMHGGKKTSLEVTIPKGTKMDPHKFGKEVNENTRARVHPQRGNVVSFGGSVEVIKAARKYVEENYPELKLSA